MFKRKVYDELLKWKKDSNGRTAVLLEGARRVGKSTIALEFAKNEYKSFILIDFAKTDKDIISLFDDINKLDFFFLKLQTLFDKQLYTRNSVIVFDEVQLCPKARQAIKYLVNDGRFDYIETGSLISIKKNVSNIVIPSEETKIAVNPMDYEEFCWAIGYDYELIRSLYNLHQPVGEIVHKKLMQQFKNYLAVGGMPQAVEAFANGKTFNEINKIKKNIIDLYKDDLKKIDKSGRTSKLYESIPAQLLSKKNKFSFRYAIKKKGLKDNERLFDLLDSKIVNSCHNLLDISPSLNMYEDLNKFKLYAADTGLFVTMLFDSSEEHKDIYKKLISNQLSLNLGYLYENMVSQMIVASGKNLFYYTFLKEKSKNYYEIDFLISHKSKVVPFEVKSNKLTPHASLDQFAKRYSKYTYGKYLISTKDYLKKEGSINLPIYYFPLLLEELKENID